jgi:hypothetical protein
VGAGTPDAEPAEALTVTHLEQAVDLQRSDAAAPEKGALPSLV